MFPSRYINLLTDFGFKRVFGTEPNKALLRDFLNTLLPPHHHIADLTFQNSEILGNTPVDRKAIFDIYCQSDSGEKFIVELQKAKQDYFKDRSVYYASFPIQEQALKGDWNFQLKAVYTVGILDFIFKDHQNDSTVLHQVELKDQEGKVDYDKVTFFYIELPKFTKSLESLETQFDKWLYLLRYLHELEDLPLLLQDQDAVFKQLFEVAEIAQLSRAEQESYRYSLKDYWDLTNVVNTARQEGFAEGLKVGRKEGIRQVFKIGREEGIEQGRELARRVMAQQMKGAGMPLETIAAITGLGLSVLESL
jgi:predicted transposase/invertase (TIGR01784 family)